jgi:colanic acid/amylovoran biosynthesis protein
MHDLKIYYNILRSANLKFFFTGHISFDNRGSEAIVRSLVKLIRIYLPEATFVIPSDYPAKDRLVWGKDDQVEIIFASIPFALRLWSQLTKFSYFQKFIILASPILPLSYRDAIESADLILSIGGDMYTDEGKFPLWIYWADKYALDHGKSVYLMGATVSSFHNNTHKHLISEHLERFNALVVRESDSLGRLQDEYGCSNAILSSDSAFWLEPKKSMCDALSVFKTEKYDKKVGINISPLLERLGNTTGVKQALCELIAKNPDTHFIFIPHVYVEGNDDRLYMEKFIDENLNNFENLSIVKELYSAEELKYVIGQLDVFIGARTHATIAAFSQLVPTICLAYSDKAFGIGVTMYGDDNYVLKFSSVNYELLSTKYGQIISNLPEIKVILKGSVDREKKLSLSVIEQLVNEQSFYAH